MRRLTKAGFPGDFVKTALLPDWWDRAAADDEGVLPDIEIRVARFLGCPIASVRDPGVPLVAPPCPGAQLRRVSRGDRDRLAPAIYAAVQISEAVTRCLQAMDTRVVMPPPDGADWRRSVARGHAVVTLDDVVSDLWSRGIPVVPVDVLPSPSFQGAAIVVRERPVIVVGHKHREPGRLAFIIAHEVGHIAKRDCAIDQPVIDGEEEVADTSEMETLADRYAFRLLAMGDEPPLVSGATYRELAQAALQIERETGAEASSIIFGWAYRTKEYGKARQALEAIYRHVGGRLKLRNHLERHLNLNGAPESDRALLRCVGGELERDAVAAR